jgi:hypothetical protein
MREAVLVELADGGWVAVPVPSYADTSQFRDKIEEELGLDTRGTVQLVQLARLRLMVKEAQA